MTLSNSKTDGMEYEIAGTKKTKDPEAAARKAYRNEVERHNTMYTLWVLAVKHKVGLLAIGNVVLLLNFAFPEWFQLVLSLIGK